MTHAHITSWLLAIILFFVVRGLYKGGNEKGGKITHMILRVFYLLILITGFIMLFQVNISLLYILKAAVGLWVIAIMEFLLMKTGKREPQNVLWIQFAIAFVLALLLGFSLPQGIDWF